MGSLYPLRFEPVYKDYMWGGNRIPEMYRRGCPPGIYAESWEISTHPDGTTRIANGNLKGKTLRDLLPAHKAGLLGRRAGGDDFPLLIKLIDSRDVLSVQVHPNDSNAAAVGGEPKTEMWYFLEGDGSSQVYCGLHAGIGRAEFLQAMENKTFAAVLQAVPARKGEAVFVPGGRVHAIDKGCLILEIQQNSNTTYRIYDWERTGADGKPREMHIDKALQVIDWENNGDSRCSPKPFVEDGIPGVEIECSPYFRLDRFELGSEARFETDGSTFHALFVAEGAGTIVWDGGRETLAAGQSWLVPADCGFYQLQPGGAGLTVLRTTLPQV